MVFWKGVVEKKILIVDNNKLFLRLLSNFLEEKGYDVRSVEDGLAALRVLESFVPAVVFVDLVMPLIDGERLCRIIRRMPEFDAVALVIVSAIAAEAEVDFAGFGADACIAKGPFKSMQVHINAVLSHLESGMRAKLSGGIYGGDVTRERQITKELIAAGRHFQVTVDNMADGFLELTPEGIVIFANRMASVLLGVEMERLLASPLAGCFDKGTGQRLLQLLASLAGECIEVGEADAVVVNDRLLLLKFVPFADGGQRSVILLMQDITRRKRVELELLRHRDQLEAEVAERTAALAGKNAALEAALAKVKTLSGLLPICASCKNIRDDQGYWNQIELYISKHSEAAFSHSLCPDCAQKLYPNVFGDKPST